MPAESFRFAVVGNVEKPRSRHPGLSDSQDKLSSGGPWYQKDSGGHLVPSAQSPDKHETTHLEALGQPGTDLGCCPQCQKPQEALREVGAWELQWPALPATSPADLQLC